MNIENNSKKLMILTVGVGGKDGEDIAHGLFFSIKNQNPDFLVLIASEESCKKTCPHLTSMVKDWGRELTIEEQIVNEINDFEFLHNKYLTLIETYIKKGFRAENIVVDYTSGTKAMSAALVSAAIAAETGSITYVYGERKEGRVKSGTERQSSITPTSIFSSKILNKFILLFNIYQFESAIKLLEVIELHPDHKVKANFLKNLATFFSDWDKFDFKTAYELLALLQAEMLKDFSLSKTFERQYIPLLVNLKEGGNCIEKVNDLVFNSFRRGEEGKYDDAVARLYRALEMLGQIEFEKEFKCTTDDVDLNKLPESKREKVELKYFDSKDKRIRIPLFNSFDVLLEINNPTAVVFEKNNFELKKHLSKRNHSILAHGSNPIDKEDFEKFYNFLTEKFQLGPKSSQYPNFAFPKLNYKF